MAKKRDQKKATPNRVPAARTGRVGRGLRTDVHVRSQTVGIHASPRYAGHFVPPGLTLIGDPVLSGGAARIVLNARCRGHEALWRLAPKDSRTGFASTNEGCREPLLWERTLFASPLGPDLSRWPHRYTAISRLVIPGAPLSSEAGGDDQAAQRGRHGCRPFANGQGCSCANPGPAGRPAQRARDRGGLFGLLFWAIPEK
jgi:hypothetical protein